MSVALLGPIPILNHQQVAWEERPGVVPMRRIIELEKKSGQAYRAQLGAGETSLKLAANGKTVEFKRLRITRERPPTQPWHVALEVVDIREAWARTWVISRYNTRRRSGDRRIVQRDVLGNLAVVDDIEYHPASLNPPFDPHGRRWTPSEILNDVLKQINDQLEGPWQFTWTVGKLEDASPIENVDLDDDGATAITRVLALIPGAQIKLEQDSTVVVYNALDGSEAKALQEAGPPVRETVIDVIADNSMIAPSSINVLLTRELEVRGDFQLLSSTNTNAANIDGRFLENVAPVPDPDLQDNPPGTWLTFERLFDLWGSNPVTGAKLSHDFIHRQWMNPHFLLGLAEFGEQRAAMSGDQAQWALRAATIKQHYYKTMRWNRRWVDRFLRLQAYRIAIIDTENGTRAPAPCWQDFALRYGSRAQLIAKQVLLARNVDGWSANIADGRVAPATVSILDEDQGIIQINLRTDPFGFAEEVIPSSLDNVPTAEIGNVDGKPRFFAELRGPGAAVPKFSAIHRAAVIMSAVPNCPIGLQQLHIEKVNLGDVAALIPTPGAFPAGAAGPVWNIRIPPKLETARFAWQDNQAEAIEAAFGLRQRDGKQLAADLASIQVNGQATRAIALAAAAVVYAGFRTRPVGQRVTHLDSAAKVVGALASVLHRVTDDNALSVRSISDALPERDLMAMLPESVVQTIRRLVK